MTTKPLGQECLSGSLQRWSYPTLFALVCIAWCISMTVLDKWDIFRELWPISLTMAFGSFIAGATPLGGATVAFPVFTKLFDFPSSDARTFGLMIQAVGMSMASAYIVARRIPVLPRVIGWTSAGGGLGIVFGVCFFQIPPPFPKLLFTVVVSAFGGALLLSRWRIKWAPQPVVSGWNGHHRLAFGVVGFVGGVLSANVGTGVDILAFMVLILAFGIEEKKGTPTSVIIMAITSLVGAFMYIVVEQDVGVVWNYWLVAVPIVIVGAPFGAYMLTKLRGDRLVRLLLCLIAIEFSTSLWLFPFTASVAIFVLVASALSAIWFATMLYHRQRVLNDSGRRRPEHRPVPARIGR